MLDNQTFTEYAKGSLVESLYGNRYKFYRMIDHELEPFDKSSEEFEDPSSNMGDDIIIFRRSIYRYIKKERLAEICAACGFLASFHKSDVWITPDNFSPEDSLHDDNFVFDAEKAENDMSSNQIYAALLAYKIQRDKNSATILFE